MAGQEADDAADKTEAPTPRRLEQAREKGQVALSREAVTFATLFATVAAAALCLPAGAQALSAAMRGLLAAAHPPEPLVAGAALSGAAALLLLPVLAAAAVAAILATLAQTGPRLAADQLAPDLGRISPGRALARIFGAEGGIELLRTLLKLGVVGAATWAAIDPDRLAAALHLPAGLLLDRAARDAVRLFAAAGAAFAALVVLDVLWVRVRHFRQLRMSHHDLREELRESEGDPQIKARLRRLREGRARQRMMAAVPKAAVVVTNPTHYAVALAYDGAGSAAPKLVAKGVDAMAARIRAKAAESGVPIVADPPLARALYRLDPETEIPAEHWQAVAAILAHVYALSGRGPPSGARAHG